MTSLRSLPLCAVASALLSCVAMAQTASPNVRIVSAIDENQLVTLAGNVNPHANAENDRGPVSASLPMADMTMVLSRSPGQQAAFDAFVASQYDASSPNYHQWLTPAEIGERFGPAQADIATITSWLASHGFTVTSVSHDRMSIHFTGTAAQAESAFHVQIHNLSVNGVLHIANMTDPQIPAALATVVLGVKGLHNFLPHPMHKTGSVVQFNQQAGKWQRVPAAVPAGTDSKAAPALATGIHPMFGSNGNCGTGCSYLEEDVAPYDFATIYNVLPLWNSNITGSGQTIAIAGTSDICLGQSGTPCNSDNDVASFRSSFGLPAGQTVVQAKGVNGIDPGVCTGSTNVCNSSDELENSLDVEWSGAVATGAQIVLVTSGYNSQTSPTNDPIYLSAQYVVDNHGDSSILVPQVASANILSVSYGECELFNGTSSNVAYYNLWQSAAAEGISVFVASGDSGSPACDDGQDQSYGNPYSAQLGLSVSGLASTPYNTAVGGTDFSWCQPTYNSSGNVVGCPTSTSSPGPYWNTSNNSSAGYESAAGYVPETPWNDSCLNPIWFKFLQSLAPLTAQGVGNSTPGNAEAACNYMQNDWYQIYEQYGVMFANLVDTVGGSGGASNCVANNTDTYTGSGLPSCTSGATSTGATTNPNTGNAQASLTLYNGGWPKPYWQTGVQGIPSDGVRDIPDTSFFAGDGALDSATLVCSAPNTGANCTAGASGTTTALEVGGTSVATPEMAGVMALINQKIGTPQGLANPGLYSLAQKQTYSSCSAESVKSNSASCYFNDVDTGTITMPCDYNGEATEGGALYENGNWIVYPNAPVSSGLASPNCAALNSGDTVGTLVSTGNTAAYNAGVGYDLATGLGSLNVANVVNGWISDAGTAAATMTVTLNPSSGSIAADASLTLTITVSGGSGTPTGSVTVAGGGYGATQSLSSGAATIVVPPNSLAPGSQTLTVTYSGDGTYASVSKTETVSVAADSPTVTVSAPATQNVANSFSVTVSVSGPVGAPVPSGTVFLSSGSYSSLPSTLNSSGTASINISAHSLAAGSDTLTATYSGSSTYAGGTGTATVSMVSTALATPSILVTPAKTSINSSQSLGVTVQVSGSSGTPTGTATLTAGSYTSTATGLDLTGTAIFTVPANSFSAGTDALSVNYSGDATYAAATSSSTTVTVTQSTYALAAGTPSPTSVSPGGTSTVTISGGTSSTGYSGTVTMNSCTLTSSSVTNPNSPPTCSVSGTITYSSGTPSGTATATVSTTAQVSEVVYPRLGNGKGWLGAGGGAVLAFLVFLGIPARRKSWRAMLGMVVLLVTLGSLAACGGGGGGGGSTGPTIPATSAGSYTFTVSGSSSPSVGTAPTTTFTITVN